MKKLMMTLGFTIALSMTANAHQVACKVVTPTGPFNLQSKTVIFSDKELRFKKSNGSDVVIKVDRVALRETGFTYPGTSGGVRAVEHTLFKRNLRIAKFNVTEFNTSFFNDIAGEVSRFVEPALFDGLVQMHGLAKAIELSPWMLRAENCVVH